MHMLSIKGCTIIGKIRKIKNLPKYPMPLQRALNGLFFKLLPPEWGTEHTLSESVSSAYLQQVPRGYGPCSHESLQPLPRVTLFQ